MLYRSFKSTIIRHTVSDEQPKLKEIPVNFDHARSISINETAEHVTLKSKNGKVVGRVNLGLKTQNQMSEPNQTLSNEERILGVYGSFDKQHGFIKSLGFIVWTPPDLL